MTTTNATDNDMTEIITDRPHRSASGFDRIPDSHVPDRITRTHVPGREGRSHPIRHEVKRELTTIRREDILRIVGAGLAALALTGWLFQQLLPFAGPLPFTLFAYGLFLLFFVVLVSFDEDKVAIRDRVMAVIIHSSAVVLLLALAVVVIFTLLRGSDAFLRWNFWTQDMSMAGPLDPVTVGGMAHAAIGTLIVIAIALAIAIPLGVITAVMMAEFPSPFTRVVRTVAEAMTALPSIVCGLFIYATYILMFGLPQSGFAAALAVTIMILPIIIRSADVVLRLVPATLKEAALATGASHWDTVMKVVLPTSRSGLMTAIVLGTARGIGETSPVLLTAGWTTFFNLNPFQGAMVTLPFATFTLVKSPEETMIARGFGAAAVLMLLVFVLFLIARLIGGRGPGILSPRQAAGARRASARDVRRFEERHQTTFTRETTKMGVRQ
ncbi:phosphate ABC transporter permease PstA [Raineyella sp. W15-4]|uniref:phosphate ABC transporter permease PstA n=1 Tax=Raineyella sp. W15-4 TaxID=3081651 RepID=UPI0029530C86|nr:phosphate ABC transporter permease PstA [Raineyella sp. W15-4]WOQ18177.1 phosphate ABC transporter permease PstA [Raineyella sp. W15-4]